MPRRAYVWILGLPLIVTALLAGESCTNSKPATGLGAGCSINSDCSGSLICAYGLCHVACVTSKDCSSGETCLPPGECELPQEATCSSTVPCVEGLVCANDTCKAPCTPGLPTGSAGGCLGGQTCSMVAAATDSVCLDNGDGGAPDGATGGDGSSSGGDGSSGSDGTMTGGDGSPCTSPETTFGLIGQGDSNPNFGSAVGALGAPRATPELLKCLHALAERTGRLLSESDIFSSLIDDWRLGLEVSVISTLAHRLTRILQVRDPLCDRVHLAAPAVAGWTLAGVLAGASRRVGRRRANAAQKPRGV